MNRTSAETSVLPTPIPDLEPVSWLIHDHLMRRKFLAGLDSGRKLLAEEILQSATQLEQTTGWDGGTLISYLGCPTRTVHDFRELSRAKLAISRSYLALLKTLAGMVETETDKRIIVLGYGNIYLHADRDIRRVEDAFLKGNFSGFDYLQLGEVNAALTSALENIDPGHRFTRASAADDPPSVHISTGRLDTLIRGTQIELVLGRVIASQMKLHIKGCRGCGEAFTYRKQRLARVDYFETPK